MRVSRLKMFNAGIVILSLLGLYSFNFKSNMHFAMSLDGQLYNYQASNHDEIVNNDLIRESQINIKRRGTGFVNKIINFLSRPKVNWFAFKDNSNNFSVTFSAFGETNALNKDENEIFKINSSFFTESFQAKGQVVIDGKEIGPKSSSSGFFKVVNGKALAGPRSLFQNINKADIEFACQAHPSVMKDGDVWDYINNETKNQAFWKAKTYRSLIGMDKKGRVSIFASGNGALLSVKEMTAIAKANGIVTATMLDAGSALQYQLKTGKYSLSFSSWNNIFNLGRTVDKIFTKLTGKLFYSQSPVYINYK